MEPGTPELASAAQSPARSSPGVRARIPIAVSIIQAFLFLVHIAIYATWTFFWGTPDFSRAVELRIALAILAVSFVAASLLAYQYFNLLVRAAYTIASVWLGLVSFFFLAACASWIVYGAPLLFGVRLEKQAVADACFGIGLLAGIYAIANAPGARAAPVPCQPPHLSPPSPGPPPAP